MTSKHKSEDYKLSAVEYYLVGDKSQIDVCKIFKCSPRSLMRWVEKYEKEGEIKRENRKPVAYKVYKEHVKFLLDEINKNKTITMTELKHKLKDKFKIELSRFHINRIVNDNNITLKITRIRHEPEKRFGKEININQKLKEFYDEIKKHKFNIDLGIVADLSDFFDCIKNITFNDIEGWNLITKKYKQLCLIFM